MRNALTEYEGLEDTENGLHDAFLRLTSLEIVEGTLTLDGYIVLPVRGLLLGRHRVQLRISGAISVEVKDDAYADQIDMHEIIEDAGVVTIRGKMPVEVIVRAVEPKISGSVAEEPFAVRKLWGWRTEFRKRINRAIVRSRQR